MRAAPIRRENPMFERAILRVGAVCLGVGLIAVAVFEALHPAREDPNNNPWVFAEYAADADWTTVHLGALAGALLLIGGLVALCGALGLGPALSAAGAPPPPRAPRDPAT